MRELGKWQMIYRDNDIIITAVKKWAPFTGAGLKETDMKPPVHD